MDSGINVHYSMYKLVKGGPLCGSCANKLMHLSQYPLVGVNIKSNLFLNTCFCSFHLPHLLHTEQVLQSLLVRWTEAAFHFDSRRAKG